MRFLADMGISHRTVSFLCEQGHVAVHLHELALDTLPDPEILVKARSDECVLLTHDLDFGELMAASGADTPTVITFRLSNMTPDNVNRYLDEVIHRHGDQFSDGVMISITDKRVRVRRLPIK